MAAFERLLDRVFEHKTQLESSATPTSEPTSPPSSTPAHHSGNFASCTARFSGAPGDSLDGFLDAVESYKDCADVGHAIALRGLSMLLTEMQPCGGKALKLASLPGTTLYHRYEALSVIADRPIEST